MFIERYRRKMNPEERSTGVSPVPTELDQALADVIEMEEIASTFQEIDGAVIKEKAKSIRKMAMEKKEKPSRERSRGMRTGKPYEEKEKERQ